MSTSSRRRCSTWTCSPASPPCCAPTPPATPRAGRPSTATRCARVVAEHGSVLVRGLGLRDAAEVGAVFRAAGRRADDRDGRPSRPGGATPDGVYSSTKWPPNQPMCMHHELSYTLEFPGLMLFACLDAPTDGGATGVADAPTVLDALPAGAGRAVRAGGLAARPATTTTRSGRRSPRRSAPTTARAVESYCRANAIEFEWQPDGGLRTRQRRSAVVRHPVTGQRCWFNQIAFLNEWTLDPEVREYLVDVYGADGLPFNTRFGNGDPIGEDVVAAAQRGLRGAHRARAVAGRRPAAGRQHPHRAQPGALRGAARGARRDGRPGAPADCSPTRGADDGTAPHERRRPTPMPCRRSR